MHHRPFSVSVLDPDRARDATVATGLATTLMSMTGATRAITVAFTIVHRTWTNRDAWPLTGTAWLEAFDN